MQKPGSLTQRWGSTMYIGQTFPGKINSLFEFERLSGASYVVASYSGGMFYGATTGQYQGVSFTGTNVTFGISLLFGFGLYVDWSGNANIPGTTGVAANDQFPLRFNFRDQQGARVYTNAVNFSQQPFNQFDNILDYVVFQNYMFAADGNKFFKFDGVTTSPVGFAAVMANYLSSGATVNNAAANVTVGIGNATLGSYAFYGSYVNSRGFESEPWPIAVIEASRYNGTTLGGSFIQAYIDLYTPKYLDVSSVNLYSYFQPATFSNFPATMWYYPYSFLANYPAVGSTTRIPLGTTIGGFNGMLNNTGSLPDANILSYRPLGVTYVIGGTSLNNVFSIASPNNLLSVNVGGLYPRYLEIFQNRMYAAGFSSALSTINWSDVAEPEGFKVDATAEVRTNDADYITGLKAYANRLMIFKKNSFHVLQADSNGDVGSIQEGSVIYGCLNNRCAITFDDFLVFLDRKGVIHFNGANIEIISDKIQPIFDRMNYNVALNTACMVHDKLRNQILISIPVDGSSFNNLTVVFDYLAKSWTTYDGAYTPTTYAQIKGYNNTKNVFYGSSSGTINWFGPSFLSDNGAGFTCMFKTRFLHDMGESVEKQFRRLYINADSGVTNYILPIKFYQDYGASVVYSVTMTLDGFQNRIDYGIPAKSLAFELFNLQSNSPLRINGFTIESRLQRRV